MSEQKLKAYAWNDEQTGYTKIIYDNTANKARSWIADEEGLRYIDVKVYRLPWADGYGDADNIPTEVYFEHGWWFECGYCGKKITEIDDFYNAKKGYACKHCYESEAEGRKEDGR